MKLLVFCYEFPPVGGGAGNALYHLAREWIQAGHRVTVVTSFFKGLERSEEKEGLKVIRLGVGRRSVGRGRILEMVRYMIKSRLDADRFYREEKPDLSVAFLTLPGGWAPLALKKKYGVPFVTELRGGDVPGFNPAALRYYHFLAAPLIRRIWKESAGIVANGLGLAGLVEKFSPGTRVSVIPNGVDASCFHPAPYKRPVGDWNLLYVGRFDNSQKNNSLLLKQIAKTPGFRLTLVGDGPDRGLLEGLVRRYGLRDRVSFKGWLKGQALVDVYRQAHAYVSASQWEGMSNSALEAMACGLPLILSDIPGHRELVGAGRNGMLFDLHEKDSLRKSLSELRQDPDRPKQMAEQSRRKALQEFGWKKAASDHLRIYEKVLGPLQKAVAPAVSEKRRWPAFFHNNLLFTGFTALTALFMRGVPLSNDQITYWAVAEKILKGTPGHLFWSPPDDFAYLLGMVYRWAGDVSMSFILIYAVTALLYLNAMYWCLGYFFKDRAVRLALSLVSMVPCYTLGMTYWGFASFEYVKARILFMPLAVVLLRLFFQWQGQRRLGWVLILCAAGGALNYEAFYLLVIFWLYLTVENVRKKTTAFLFQKEILGASLLSGGLIACFHFGHRIVSMLLGEPSRYLLTPVYERIFALHAGLLSLVGTEEWIARSWEAARTGFWWALFPPGAADIPFTFLNAAFILLFALLGFRVCKKENPAFHRQLLLFSLCTFVAAYGYQGLRYLGWKFFGWGPHFFEETRAIKFIFFPLYLWTGFYLLSLLKKKKRWLWVGSLLLLFISPLEILRALPEQSKNRIYSRALGWWKTPQYEGYILKALRLGEKESRRELREISSILKEEGEGSFVLSDRHELKESGQTVLVSYQDKRYYVTPVEGRPVQALTFWYVAYKEVSEALRSGDPERIRRTAQKYGCSYVVTESVLAHPLLQTMFEGEVFHLYRVLRER